MEQEIARKITEIQDAAWQDPTYRRLTAQLRLLDGNLLAALDTMTPSQRAAVEDYLGLVGEMHRQMLIIACSRGNA